MELEGASVLRLDYVLPENSDELYENLEEWFDSPPSTTISTTSIGGSRRRDHTFTSESPTELDSGLGFFDTFSIRAAESYAVTEIITCGTIEEEQITYMKNEFQGSMYIQFDDFEQTLEIVREYIPGEESGAETTVSLIQTGAAAAQRY